MRTALLGPMRVQPMAHARMQGPPAGYLGYRMEKGLVGNPADDLDSGARNQSSRNGRPHTFVWSCNAKGETYDRCQ